MSRRKTVKLNLEVVLPLIKEKCRSNVVFCEKMGRPTQKTWVTGWSNKPKPKNPPSPEEAARMCVLLKTTPDEILLREGETPEETAKCLKDIETVRKLVEAESAKKAPDPKTEGEDELDIELREIWDSSNLDDRKAILEYAHFVKARRQK